MLKSATCSVLLTCGVIATPSHAAMAQAPQPAQVSRIDDQAIRQGTRTGAQIESSRLANSKAAAAVQRHLDEEARRGNLVDRKDVHLFTSRDAATNVEVGVVWDGSARPDRIDIVRRDPKGIGANQLGVGVGFREDPQAAGVSSPTASSAGFGYENVVSYKGVSQVGSTSCGTVYWTPDYYSQEDHWSTTCYQKWKQSGTKNWIYNRWGLFDQAESSTNSPRTVDVTFRSKPWSGYESRVTGIKGWSPAFGPTTCSDTANYTLSFSSTVSVTIPIHRCNSMAVLPNATQHSMGMDFDGETTNQVYLDYGLALYASDSATTPVYADYTWAEVDWGAVWDPNVNTLLWTDSGW
ncbi:hypothetical protein ACGFIJ_14270 [Microbispora bryophytorum]|uniref:hypothetical protein n=1 Tax=Microbispora bryophytorum TaxID=1460882 RepID=UPI0037192EE4